MTGTVIWKLLAVLNKQKNLGNICFCEQTVYRKQSLGAPYNCYLNFCRETREKLCAEHEKIVSQA